MKILHAIAQLADNAAAYEDQLDAAGFTAFRPFAEATGFFCEEREIGCHSRYNIEVAKLFVGTPSGSPGHLALQHSDAYRSEFIERLRAARDLENGFPYNKIPLGEFWRRELDPCLRRQKRLFPNPAVQHAPWLIKMLQDRRTLRESEAEVHSAGIGYDFDDTPSGWEQFWLELLRVYVAPLGFTHDTGRSSKFLPVYSRAITPYWALCFSLSDADYVTLQMKLESAAGDFRTRLPIELSVRAPKGKARKLITPLVWADKMVIRYMRLVHGFEWAYGSFADFDEWEASLRAFVFLYRLVSQPIEDILRRELS